MPQLNLFASWSIVASFWTFVWCWTLYKSFICALWRKRLWLWTINCFDFKTSFFILSMNVDLDFYKLLTKNVWLSFFSYIKWLIFCVRFLNQYLLNWHHYSCSTFSGILSFCLFFRLFSLSIHESISKNYY